MANFGLIGHPLSHSFSQEYFNKKFDNETLNNRYLNLDLIEISNIKSRVEEAKIDGFNVTIPYKQAIIPYLDSLDNSAQEIGAVNCVKIKDGKWVGFNTDYIGFSRSLLPLLNKNHRLALILGTGGASKAIAYALGKMNIKFDFVSREKINGMLYSELNGKMSEYQIVINTTPVGTFPDIEFCPDIPFAEINASHICYDLVYNPARSLFLEKANSNGAIVKNGREMLEIQAEEAWEIWQSDKY